MKKNGMKGILKTDLTFGNSPNNLKPSQVNELVNEVEKGHFVGTGVVAQG